MIEGEASLNSLTEGLRQDWKRAAMVEVVEAYMRRQREAFRTTFYIGEDSMGGLRHPGFDIDQIIAPKPQVLTPPAQIRFYRRRQMRRTQRSGR